MLVGSSCIGLYNINLGLVMFEGLGHRGCILVWRLKCIASRESPKTLQVCWLESRPLQFRWCGHFPASISCSTCCLSHAVGKGRRASGAEGFEGSILKLACALWVLGIFGASKMEGLGIFGAWSLLPTAESPNE